MLFRTVRICKENIKLNLGGLEKRSRKTKDDRWKAEVENDMNSRLSD